MLKTYALWFGVIFLIIGVLGFFPPLAPNGMLLGIFHVDALHNIVHLLTGGVALGVAAAGERASRMYFQIFGVIYAIVALLGFVYGNTPLLGIMAHNWADVWVHVAIAAVALYLGFGYRRHTSGRTAGRV
jgi:hypothetical protein